MVQIGLKDTDLAPIRDCLEHFLNLLPIRLHTAFHQNEFLPQTTENLFSAGLPKFYDTRVPIDLNLQDTCKHFSQIRDYLYSCQSKVRVLNLMSGLAI